MTRNKLTLLLIALSFFCGCSGYKIGHTMHPQIKTIAIGKITNATDQPSLSIFMIEKLKERFMQDASVKVVRLDQNPDIILTGSVIKYDVNFSGSVTEDRQDRDNGFNARISRAQLTFKYDVKTRKNWDVNDGTVTGKAEFTQIIDQLEEMRSALRRAAYDASKEVVAQITEAW